MPIVPLSVRGSDIDVMIAFQLIVLDLSARVLGFEYFGLTLHLVDSVSKKPL